MDMRLYDNNQVEIPNSRVYGNDGQNFMWKVKICQGGQYYIRLRDLGDDKTNTQLYSLTVTFDATDVNECNDDFDQATSIQLCTAVTSTIRSVGDLDYYQLGIPSSGITRIRLLEVPTNIDMEIKVYNASRVQVGNTLYAATGQANSFDVNLPTSGNHFIQFSDRSNNASSVNKYKFTIERGCVTSSDDLSNVNFKVSPNPVTDRLQLHYTEGSFSRQNLPSIIKTPQY